MKRTASSTALALLTAGLLFAGTSKNTTAASTSLGPTSAAVTVQDVTTAPGLTIDQSDQSSSTLVTIKSTGDNPGRETLAIFETDGTAVGNATTCTGGQGGGDDFSFNTGTVNCFADTKTGLDYSSGTQVTGAGTQDGAVKITSTNRSRLTEWSTDKCTGFTIGGTGGAFTTDGVSGTFTTGEGFIITNTFTTGEDFITGTFTTDATTTF